MGMIIRSFTWALITMAKRMKKVSTLLSLEASESGWGVIIMNFVNKWGRSYSQYVQIARLEWRKLWFVRKGISSEYCYVIFSSVIYLAARTIGANSDTSINVSRIPNTALLFNAGMKSYIPLETAAIFFLANLFLKHGISSDYVMVDFICIGLLDLFRTRTENYKRKIHTHSGIRTRDLPPTKRTR